MSSPRPSSPHATLAAVASLVDGELAGADRVVTGVTLSSQDVVEGDLYAALPGANTHGARYAAGARDAGAVAVLTDAEGAAALAAEGLDLPRVVVEDPRSHVGQVASLVYGTVDLPLQMYGVTGTNGKTTTAYLVNSALIALGHTTGLIGTVETRIGDERIKSVRTTPEATVLHALLAVMTERGIDSCVMEVSSHALSQHRVDGVVYDIALFTNLSQDHLDFHPTMRDYFLAKADLFTPQRSRTGIVCVDDEWGRELAATISTVPVTTVTSLADVDADWRLVAGEEDPATFTLSDGSTALHLRSALPGDFNRVNTAMAALALLAAGIPADDAERALLVDPHVPGRMERVVVEPAEGPATGPGSADLPLVVVDYAHTPDAVAAALKALRPATSGRLVVVLGAGGDRDRGKRAAMGRAAAEGADLVVVTDDNPRSEVPGAIRAAVLDGARAAGTAAELRDVEGRASAIAQAVRAAHEAGPGSVVAVVGKGHETGQEIAGTVHPFDDRDEARRALDSLLDQTPHDPDGGAR
ncbi:MULTISPECIES: UDP-N-acetylmuramoyl-L-alanyl-D-glutamate--2,6-diaminopimelate ligase [unclassified Phycicoccus]|uniref:UDP-N-acetylmuramoyl-L-alanyl-D-glutamate--2, 6-diaminopimelate ligase n=1 Tax=unclassified Phycicoccus TaxID=2637926 RepID=UPI0007024632|nr:MULTISPECIES: UDP-N-acetylmuramoyl-L-alanyl-D-glutamate--2,6-diaminopimelate ligase [unclassified Phycicoccus]KRF25297.1 UDP-N-acetylmuramoylalanyl-D-glutamate--2,6-diaminopimelate ligase [Phycicoccus sp. Soil803]KRF29546.1 UDP-N-acetylmuramoylalanyl-D-glutamate--2,6-diaminopimelate ligase [Phycicoccus sp. Soil802]